MLMILQGFQGVFLYHLGIYYLPVSGDDSGMDIQDIRRNNLHALMHHAFRGERGPQTRLAEKLGRSQNYLSRCLAPEGSPGARNIGERFAREIEAAFSLPPYAMDLPGLFKSPDLYSGLGSEAGKDESLFSEHSSTKLTEKTASLTLAGAPVPKTKTTGATAGATHEGDKDRQSQITSEPLRVVAARVPVVGKAMLGKDGYFDGLDYPVGHGDGYLAVPSSDPNAYALRVVGNSMLPRIKSGEYVLIEPAQTYTNGDDVLVRTRDGRAMIKEFVYLRDGQYRFDSYSADHDPVYLDEAEVASIHFVGGIFKSYRYSPD